MREKSLKLIVTFPTTTAAMAMEKACAQKQIPGRLIPVPRELTAGCGMAWCAPPAPETRALILQAAQELQIETGGCHEMLV